MKLRTCPNCLKEYEVADTYREKGKFCTSCGNTTHGFESHSLYAVWKSMLTRCYNKTSKAYPMYGGYGVTVVEEWRNTPKEFIEWAENNNYKKGYFLDKDFLCSKLGIQPHIYGPNTCMFIDRTSNNQKTRLLKSTNTSGYRGITYQINNTEYPWEAKICINKKRIKLGYWKTKLEAAKAYDYYVLSNKLNHTSNGVLEKNEIIDIESANSRLKANNSTGYKGIQFRKDTNKWTARITVNKKKYNLGCFENKESAILARKKAEKLLKTKGDLSEYKNN